MSTAPWTVGRLLQWTTDYLKSHGSESPRLDAEVLLAESLGRQRIELYTTFDEEPSEPSRAAFRELVRRRAEGAPVAYLVGRREFYSMSFRVTPDVLIPRPETELLVVATLDLAKARAEEVAGGQWPVAGEYNKGERGEGRGERKTQIHQSEEVPSSQSSVVSNPPSALRPPPSSNPQSLIPNPSIADVGTGSGIIAVCLAKHLPTCRVTAIDISPAALAIAQKNAQKHGVSDRIEFIEGDLFAAVPPERRFDFIVSNPPYITTAEMQNLPPDVRKFEPRQALLAGPRGTEVIERLIDQSAERLQPGGHLLMEISPTIHGAVQALLQSDARFEPGPTIKDLARLPRIVQAKKKV